MDVGAPSNFERLHVLEDYTRDTVSGYGIPESATRERLLRTYEEDGLIVCPHTAVGLEALARHRRGHGSGPAVALATAHPAKFPEVVSEVLAGQWPRAEQLDMLTEQDTTVLDISSDSAELKQFLLSW